MSYARIAHTFGQSTDSNTFSTAPINTSGADLIVVLVVSYQAAAAPTLSDSKGNAWSPLTVQSVVSDPRAQLFYCQGPTVGAGHQFTATGVGSFPGLFISAYSGSVATPFDVENGSNGTGTASRQAGIINPNEANELVIAGIAYDGTTGGEPTIDGGFTVQDRAPLVGGQAYGGALADLIQTTAASANPTWAWTGNQPSAAVIASFKAAAGGGAGLTAGAESSYLPGGMQPQTSPLTISKW